MKHVPTFLRGPMKQAYKVALEETTRASDCNDQQARIRAWKLFMLLPRLLLHRPLGETIVYKEILTKRFDDFNKGKWTDLMVAPLKTVVRSNAQSNDEKRATRAESRWENCQHHGKRWNRMKSHQATYLH